MPAGTISLILIILAVPAGWWSIAYGLPWLIDRDAAIPADAVHSADILDRVAAEGSLRTDSWQLEPSHRTPTAEYTPEQAHATMQQHRECTTDWCDAKHAAFWTLADAGLLIPDARAIR